MPSSTPSQLTREKAEDLLYREAELLDDRSLEEWLKLFSSDGTFWIPLDEDCDPEQAPSILYDNALARQQRVYQLLHQPHYAQLPPSRTIHYVSNVRVGEADADGVVTVRCNVSVEELRPGDQRSLQYGLGTQRTLAARCEYRFRHEEGGWKIVRKKMALINRDLPIDNLSFIL